MTKVNAVFRWGLALMLMLVSVIVEPLTRAFRLAMVHAVPRRFALPRVLKFAQHQFVKRGKARILAGGAGFRIGVALAALVLIAISVLAAPAHAAGALLALSPAATRDLKSIMKELLEIQEEYKGKAMPADVGKKFRELAQEGEALQEEADREKQIKNLERFSREVPDPALPADPAGKSRTQGDNQIAGYLTLGEAVVRSEAFKSFASANFPRGTFPVLAVQQLHKGFVPLTRKQREEWEAKIATVPTLGTGVLEPARLADIVQVTADDQTVLRDVLNVSQTTSSSVEYVREESYTRAAAPVAHGATKPFGALAYTLQTATVRTLAVWIPVTVQMLSDWPALKNLIDNRLLYDLRKEEEEQVMYGGGSGQEFAGIVPNAGHDISVSDARVTAPTIVDQVRIGMTDVKRSGYQPNALVIDPLDWEAIVLTKGDDDHYLAQVFPDNDGNMRVWGLKVVETVAAEENAGNATEARNLVVGDFKRGATLWIREEASVVIGMQNDDLTKNLRTILAEERAAFAVTAPDAFAVLETQASAT